jgi:NADH:ubiquinone oxidoreductase subunit F (NADH-binding)
VSRHAGLHPIHEHVFTGNDGKDLQRVVGEIANGKSPAPDTDNNRVIDRKGWMIDVYAKRPDLPPYSAVKRFFEEQKTSTPDDVTTRWLKELEISTLAGMGGAGMPAFIKWRDVRQAKGTEKYIVCNGDESEPGTFKDRELLLRTPHLVVEGVIMAGLITGATRGYVYIRHEYPEQIDKVNEEINRARQEGVCGADILGSDRSFTVEVFISPGGYICGEQSALIEAMEDKRAQPRNRPPELMTNGLFDKPTVVNNVETLAWTPGIFLESGAWYRDQGGAPLEARRGKGWRVLSISGDLGAPGVFEIPIGLTLGELIDRAGKVRGKLKAVATSGPSGGFLPSRLKINPANRDQLARRVGKIVDGTRESDPVFSRVVETFARQHLTKEADSVDVCALPLDLNFFRIAQTLLGWEDEIKQGRKQDLMLGAGLVVYSEEANLLSQAVNATEFFRNESCGKCVPCRIGSEKLVEVGLDLLKQRKGEQVATMSSDEVYELDHVMQQASICGLGQVAGKPLTTWLDYFEDGQTTGG